jgi:redox-sensitive bicupin YhaK (pirin superfamily)
VTRAQHVELIEPREVPLGGPRAMTVRRTLPQRPRSLVGAWCFVDHYGPDAVATTGGMVVPPHPHTGLQTVSWLFEGEVEHRDSTGARAIVRPGEVNLMTAGHGVSHSEVSTPGTSRLHGVQLWVALPRAAQEIAPAFEHNVPDVDVVGDATLRVFLGTYAGTTAGVTAHSPIVGAELRLGRDATTSLPLDPAFEHALLIDGGVLDFAGTPVPHGRLAYVGNGVTSVELQVLDGDDVRVLLLGGEPFGEEIVMWWNFVARSHDEIEQQRAAWQSREARFGVVEGYVGEPSWLPAPELPHLRLKPRPNPPTGHGAV